MLDSGGGSYQELVYDDQIEWWDYIYMIHNYVKKNLHFPFRVVDTSSELTAKYGDIPAIAFSHIPR